MKSSIRTPMRMPKTPRSRPLSSEQQQMANNNNNNSNKPRDPVHVFCRVRPLQSVADLSSVRVKNSTTVILTPPEQALQQYKQGTQREMQYIFKHVFEPEAGQREVFAAVAQPLVENLIRGRNSLLFTYGVTGSGKTYTMTGDARHRGIMPRCLDVLFKTISDYQAKKFIFKPDKLNGFEIQSEEDALLERSSDMNNRFRGGGVSANAGGGLRRKDSDTEIASQASCDMPPLQGIEEDNMFAVFITYIEVYNNSVYDLLEDGGIQKTLQSKIIREDCNHNMFVHGVTEIEIKTMEEAIEAFQMGQKRKRMGHTVLNSESSRSHSVFNIRLVQAPTDSQGERVIQDKRTITVSQLSLVDLAGSERCSRTKNTGLRLREAGNINNSLMNLRTCLEYLRENQQMPPGAAPKKIPYRDSKITHIFKNYFDGEGQVSMIVCINPRAEDYDENLQVMKFAEMTQEVQVVRATPIRTDLGLTPGRRKANKMFKIAVNNLNDLGHTMAKKLDVDVGLVYTLGPSFPEYKIDSPEAEQTIQELMQCLMHRIERRKILTADLENRCDNFRLHLMQMEKENLSLQSELASIKAAYKQESERGVHLEKKIRLHESSIDTLNLKLRNRECQIDELTRELAQQKKRLQNSEKEKDELKRKYTAKLAVEVDKNRGEVETQFKERRAKLEEKLQLNNKKLRLVSKIIQSENVPNKYSQIIGDAAAVTTDEETATISTAARRGKIQLQQHQHAASMAPTTTPRTDTYYQQQQQQHRHVRGAAVANTRHRRSRSAGDKWLEHRAQNPVPLGTILQPYLKNRKSITKLTDMKDLTGHGATKYCLISQDADTDGDVETKLFKGNVIPTCGGGAQVVFDDVECLKQKSPVTSPHRKRPNANDLASSSVGGALLSDMGTVNSPITMATTTTAEEVMQRCNVGIEGHMTKRSKI